MALLSLVLAQVLDATPAPIAALRVARDSSSVRCPDATALRAEVRSRLGYEAFDDALPRSIEVSFALAPRGLRAELVLRSPSGDTLGRRALTSTARDCRELRGALALALAVAIEQLRLTIPPAIAPAVAPVPAPPAAPAPPPSVAQVEPAPTPTPTPAPAPTPTPGDRVRFLLGFGANGTLGTHPVAAFGFDAALGVRWRRLSLSAEARIQPSARAEGRAGSYALTEWYGGNLAACVALPWSELCALGQLGALLASGRNVDRPRTVTAFTGSAGVRAAFVAPLVAGLDVRVFLELGVPFTRVQLSLADATLWENPYLTGAAGVRFCALIP